jgi:wyosine [tRNA(Phe)-imidazoG37] synthetase (radical SAM superfamily)
MAEFGRFPKEVWLEVLLLAGVTSIPTEVKKIAILAERIGLARIQLNTVVRPPAEDFAPVSPGQVQVPKGFFPAPVDVICESMSGNGEALLSLVEDADILALLKRRPCSPGEVATGLGIHVAEAIKRLNVLIVAGKVRWVVSGGRNVCLATDP